MALSFSVAIGGTEVHFEHPTKRVEVFDFVSSHYDSAVIEIIDDRFQHVEVDVVEDERAFVALKTLNLPGEIRRSSCEHDLVGPDGEGGVAGGRDLYVSVRTICVKGAELRSWRISTADLDGSHDVRARGGKSWENHGETEF